MVRSEEKWPDEQCERAGYLFEKVDLVRHVSCTCLIGLYSDANKINRKYQGNISDTARVQNVDSMLTRRCLCQHTVNIMLTCWVQNVAGATTTWSLRPAAYLTTNMSFSLASFFVSQFCMQGWQIEKEPSKNAFFYMIAQPAKLLVHFVALKVVQKCGLCLPSGQTS